MEAPEGEAPVDPEDRPARGAEVAAPQFDGLGVGGGHGQFFGIRGLTSYAVGPRRPQLVAQVIELLEEVDASAGQRGEVLVHLCELHPEHLAPGLEPQSALVRDALDLPQGLALSVLLPQFALRGCSEGAGFVVGAAHGGLASAVVGCRSSVEGRTLVRGRRSGEWCP